MEKRLSELMDSLTATEKQIAEETDNAEPTSSPIPLQRTKSPMEGRNDADPNHKLDQAREEYTEPTNLRRNDLSEEIKLVEEAVKRLAPYVLDSSDPDALMIYRTLKRLLVDMKTKENAAAVDMEQERYNHESQQRYGMKRTSSFSIGDKVHDNAADADGEIISEGKTLSQWEKENPADAQHGWIDDERSSVKPGFEDSIEKDLYYIVKLEDGMTVGANEVDLRKAAMKRTAMFPKGTHIEFEHNGEIWEGTVVGTEGVVLLVDHEETEAAGLMRVDPYSVVAADEPSDLSGEAQLDATRGQQPVDMRANSQHTPIDSEPKSSIGARRTADAKKMYGIVDKEDAEEQLTLAGVPFDPTLTKQSHGGYQTGDGGVVLQHGGGYTFYEKSGDPIAILDPNGILTIRDGVELKDGDDPTMGALEQEAPMKSQKQRSYLWATNPELAREFEDKTPKGKKLPKYAVLDMQGQEIDVHDVVEWEGKNVEIVDVMESGNVMISYEDKLIGVHPQETVKVGFYRKSEKLISFADAKRFAYDIGDGADIKDKVNQFRKTMKRKSASKFQVGDTVQHDDGREGVIVSLPTVGTMEPFEASVEWNGDPDTEFNVDLDKLTKIIVRGGSKRTADWRPEEPKKPESITEDYVVGDRVMFYDPDAGDMPQVGEITVVHPDGNMNIKNENGEQLTIGFNQVMRRVSMKRTASLEKIEWRGQQYDVKFHPVGQSYSFEADGETLWIEDRNEDGTYNVVIDIEGSNISMGTCKKVASKRTAATNVQVGDWVHYKGDIETSGKVKSINGNWVTIEPGDNNNWRGDQVLMSDIYSVNGKEASKRTAAVDSNDADLSVGDTVKLVDDPDNETAKVIKVVSDNAIWIEWPNGSQDARHPGEFVKVASKRGAMQKTANDKLMKHLDFDDIALGIEWPKDSLRQYSDGFKQHMKCDYGFVRNSLGADGEDLDVYVGDPNTLKVHRIQQLKPETGEHDEYKYMLGFPDVKSAVSMYLQHMPLEHFGGCEEMSLDDFRNTCRTGEQREDISSMEMGV